MFERSQGSNISQTTLNFATGQQPCLKSTFSEVKWQTTNSEYSKNHEDFDIASAIKTSRQTVSEFSHRPIRCPILDCTAYVAFSAFTQHFVFDHPKVPIINVEPGMKITLVFNLSRMLCNSSRCLGLLLASHKLTWVNLDINSQIMCTFRYFYDITTIICFVIMSKSIEWIGVEKQSRTVSQKFNFWLDMNTIFFIICKQVMGYLWRKRFCNKNKN